MRKFLSLELCREIQLAGGRLMAVSQATHPISFAEQDGPPGPPPHRKAVTAGGFITALPSPRNKSDKLIVLGRDIQNMA